MILVFHETKFVTYYLSKGFENMKYKWLGRNFCQDIPVAVNQLINIIYKCKNDTDLACNREIFSIIIHLIRMWLLIRYLLSITQINLMVIE